ncbi:MAG: ATP-binding protein [Thermoleophilia bacterium]|nr:ATP-binding protein [Thermoleophilia bacterium]
MGTSTPRTEHHLRVAAEDGAVVGVRDDLARALAELGWADACRTRVLLAADEAVANAVRHGSRPGGQVDVGFRADARAVLVRVVDRGSPEGTRPAFPPTAPPDPTATHGRGLLLMCALCDRLSVSAYGPGTRVEMAFRRAEGALAA